MRLRGKKTEVSGIFLEFRRYFFLEYELKEKVTKNIFGKREKKKLLEL